MSTFYGNPHKQYSPNGNDYHVQSISGALQQPAQLQQSQYCCNEYYVQSPSHAGESQIQQIHIYMSQGIVQRAVDNGLFALVGDGIHQLNPRSKHGAGVRIEDGQVYTVHGICRGGYEIPLLFAIMRNKREQDYVLIFEKLRAFLEAANAELANPQLRFIMDFELVGFDKRGKNCVPEVLQRRMLLAPEPCLG
ncbi:unnamed protein product [Strongylus vulgaris]|uniref:MULE transposase domain-containing protein n=1 Tax=Strongylus vulgaris TaxID=40348 RepID=A0A3P7JSD9_STRVU|nr:unnamed protein product [Strongylus vulgaris]